MEGAPAPSPGRQSPLPALQEGHSRRRCWRTNAACFAYALLAGVNDRAADLEELSWALLASGILPYYLHLLDPAAGTAHFQVSLDRAAAIEVELRRRLPGYLVPRLVRDGPDLEFKAPP